jgi:ABC-2 type transport system permease protein
MNRAIMNSAVMNRSAMNSARMTMSQQLNIYRMESKFEWLKTIRNPAFSLPVILFPVLFYLFFGVVFNHGNVQGASYLLCTYGVFGIMGPALFSFGAGLAAERSQGWLDIKEASPMPASAQIVARITVSMCFSLIIVVLLSMMAMTLAGVSLSIGQLILLSLILVIGGLPFCLLGLALGLTVKSDSAPAIVNLIYLPMSFLSGLWIPISVLPDFLQSLAQFLPPYHLAQLALKVVEMDQGQSAVWHIGMLMTFALGFFLLTLLAYKRKSA